MKQIQPFCNVTAIRQKCKELQEYSSKRWDGFSGNNKTFADLQDEVKKEYEYLHGFWHKDESGEIDYVIDEKFFKWNCLPAFYDLPQYLQDWSQGRTKEFRISGCCKYDIFHKREKYLEDTLWWIFSLFHDWQFCSQGWTAY